MQNKPSQQKDIIRLSDHLPESFKTHSQFIKRVSCSQCGAPKSLPSKTAYIYCDFCGSLIDYDFRLANANTNGAYTNTAFHRIIAPHQTALAQAKAQGDRDTYRKIYTQVFSQWLQECPMAVSPRAMNDLPFRQQLIAYFAECAVTKDLDPRQIPLEAAMQELVALLKRYPGPDGTWMVSGNIFWDYAEVFKQQMEMAYALIEKSGVAQMDPDNAQPGVALRMEYSTFCQSWLPHLSPQDGERLLKYYGVSAEYDMVKPQQTDHRLCGCCGSEIQSLPGAKQVVCESCGFTIDVGSQAIPCSKCGSLLSFPVSAAHLLCPYCSTDNRRI